jgi:hypothetical protein
MDAPGKDTTDCEGIVDEGSLQKMDTAEQLSSCDMPNGDEKHGGGIWHTRQAAEGPSGMFTPREDETGGGNSQKRQVAGLSSVLDMFRIDDSEAGGDWQKRQATEPPPGLDMPSEDEAEGRDDLGHQTEKDDLDTTYAESAPESQEVPRTVLVQKLCSSELFQKQFAAFTRKMQLEGRRVGAEVPQEEQQRQGMMFAAWIQSGRWSAEDFDSDDGAVLPQENSEEGQLDLSLLSLDELHLRGKCKPCAYFHTKDDSCRRGAECEFCHLCPAGEVKVRKQMKIKAKKVQQRAARALAQSQRQNALHT